MVSRTPPRHSLKTRITFAMLGIFLAGIWALSFFSSQILRTDMERLLGEQQMSVVSIVVDQISDQVDSRRAALEVAAGLSTQRMLDEPAAMQEFIESLPVLQLLFNGGIVALGGDGMAVADFPASAERRRINAQEVAALMITLREGSTAFVLMPNNTLPMPTFAIAVPIRDARNAVIGVLVGLTNLGEPNFLRRIAEGRYGRTGGYLLITTQSRLIIAATDTARIAETLPAPGTDPIIDHLSMPDTGGSTIGNLLGVDVLISHGRIPLTNWVLSATLPTKEAFAPISAMQQRMSFVTILLTLLTGWLVWWVLRRKFSPMLAAVNALGTMDSHGQPFKRLSIFRDDEIGQLIGGFNRVFEALKRREEELAASEARLRATLDSALDGVVSIDALDRLIYFNPAAEAIFGWKKEEILGHSIVDFLVPGQHRKAHLRGLANYVRTRKTTIMGQRIEITALRRDDSEFPVELSITAFQQNGVDFFTAYLRDISERKQMEAQVHQLAFYDTLTRLPNRRLLNDRLMQTMVASKRSGCYGALMFLDLDNFKPLNDRHGHDVGDLLLIEAAERLRNCVREKDTVSRFGGDEFVVILSDLSADKAESISEAGIVAEKIRIALSEPYLLTIRHEEIQATPLEHRCTTSIGVVLFMNHDASQDELVKQADLAMYRAKTDGANTVRFHDMESRQEGDE
jgi:diguanylate cyclase (GGDEF)-like protein/PAS domain S-box-containing protein